MKILKKKPFYIVLMVIATLVLCADLAIYLLTPDVQSFNPGAMGQSGSFSSDGSAPGMPGNGDGSTSDEGSTGDGSGSASDDGSGSTSDGSGSTSDGSGSTSDGSGSASDGSGSTSDGNGSASDGSGSTSDGNGGTSDSGSTAGSDGNAPSMPGNNSDGNAPSMPDGSSDGNAPSMPDGSSDGNAPSMPGNNSDGSSSGMSGQQSAGVIGILMKIKNLFLPILIICLLIDILCGVRIFFISRKQKKEKEAAAKMIGTTAGPEDGTTGTDASGNVILAGSGAALAAEDPEVTAAKRKKSTRRKIMAAVAIILVIALLLASLPNLLNKKRGVTETVNEEVITSTAATGDIDTTLSGSGSLEEEDADELTIPGDVELESYLVSNGDTVSKGDKIATVNTTSVMVSIAKLQTLLETLDEEIEDCEDTSSTSKIKASADGRVMAIYAKKKEAVVDTMYDHESLMLLSLDGYLRVKIKTSADLSVGDKVNVVLSDGTSVSGKVSAALKGKVTILVSDAKASYGEKVTVKTTGGKKLGSGKLAINSELKVTGFLGTVTSIPVSVGDEVEEGDTLIRLKDTDVSAEKDALYAERSELQDQMADLFQIYQDGCIYASCDGVVSGVDEDLAEEAESADSSETTASADSTSSSGTTASADSTSSSGTTVSADSTSSSGTTVSADSTGTTENAADTGITASDTGASLAGTSGRTTANGVVSSARYTASNLSTGSKICTVTKLSTASGSASSAATASGSASSTATTSGSASSTATASGSATADASAPTSSAEYSNIAGVVTAISSGKLQVLTDNKKITISNYSDLSSIDSSSFTQKESITPDSGTTVFVYDKGWTVGALSDIKKGDLLVFTYDSDGALQWIVCQHSSSSDSDEKGSEDTDQEESESDESSAGKNTDETKSDTDKKSDGTDTDKGKSDGSNTGKNTDGTKPDTSGTGDTKGNTGTDVPGGDTSGGKTPSGNKGTGDTGTGKNGTGDIGTTGNGKTGTGDTGTGGMTLPDGTTGNGTTGTGTTGTGTDGTNAAITAAGSTDTTATSAETEEETITGIGETSVCSVTPQDSMVLTVSIDELDILSISQGQNATVVLDALEGQTFEGKVTSVDQNGSNNGGNTKYSVDVTIDRTSDMLAGMNASAVIDLGTTSDVLTIPEAALVEQDGATYVYTSYDEKNDELGSLKEVETGVSDGTNVQITDGLSEGDTYYYKYADSISYKIG